MFHVVKSNALLRDKDRTNDRNDHSQDVILLLLSPQGPGMPWQILSTDIKGDQGKRST